MCNHGFAARGCSDGHRTGKSTLIEAQQAGIEARVAAALGPDERALFEAARADRAELGQELLARGADPNAAEKTGHTALHFAALAGDEHIVDVLTAAGADRHARNNYADLAIDPALRQSRARPWRIRPLVRSSPSR